MAGMAETQTSHREIKTAQFVACKRVCAALQNDRSRVVRFHNLLYYLPRKEGRILDVRSNISTHRLENTLVVLVVDSISEREIQRVIFPFADADVL